MFLRAKRRFKDGKEHGYWSIVENRRVAGGRVVGSWTRFRVLGVIPVARMGGDTNHARAAYGRYVAEAVFWTPAALLPGPGVVWEALNQDTARVTVTHNELSQAVDMKVDVEGRPVVVHFMRWTNANPEKKHRLQPFGGHLSDFLEVQGFRIPFNVEAGNMFGTDEYFAFFKAKVTAVRFPAAGSWSWRPAPTFIHCATG